MNILSKKCIAAALSAATVIAVGGCGSHQYQQTKAFTPLTAETSSEQSVAQTIGKMSDKERNAYLASHPAAVATLRSSGQGGQPGSAMDKKGQVSIKSVGMITRRMTPEQEKAYFAKNPQIMEAIRSGNAKGLPHNPDAR